MKPGTLFMLLLPALLCSHLITCMEQPAPKSARTAVWHVPENKPFNVFDVVGFAAYFSGTWCWIDGATGDGLDFHQRLVKLGTGTALVGLGVLTSFINRPRVKIVETQLS